MKQVDCSWGDGKQGNQGDTGNEENDGNTGPATPLATPGFRRLTLLSHTIVPGKIDLD